MTTKPTTGGGDGPASVPDCAHLPSLPDRPEEDHDMREALHYGYFTAMMRAYFNRYGIDAFVGNHVRVQQSVGARYFYADCAIIFNADSERIHRRNGYVIEEFGLPPDFLLETASETTGELDSTGKREGYEALQVREYWRFDHTGGTYSNGEALAGDRLVEGRYEPAPLTTEGDGLIWGHSQVLGLDLCWQEGRLRVWDPVHQEYLKDPEESEEGRLAAEALAVEHLEARRAAEEGRLDEQRARLAAEAEIQRLRAQLERRG